jgi:hypothetical protein
MQSRDVEAATNRTPNFRLRVISPVPSDQRKAGTGPISPVRRRRLVLGGRDAVGTADPVHSDFYIHRVVEGLSLVVAVGAAALAYLSWRTAQRANEISGRALQVTEAEHAARVQERRARAKLELTVAPGSNHEVDPHGVIWTQASAIVTTLELTILNKGDRAGGRTSVEVWVPRFTGHAFWANGAGGAEVAGLSRAVPDSAVRLNEGSGAPTYEADRLTRELEGIPIDLPTRLYVRTTFPIEGHEVAYPVDVVVRAEHTDDDTRARRIVRIKRHQY